ncbi:50S ribosomal protein L21 [Patescibacteria group bacterium]|nr:50S ribosomal protein L21 [Patescibacteria group bacterium]
MFAIVEITGKQYKVSENDQIEVDTLNLEEGTVKFDKVLMYAKDDKNTEIGNPYIKNAVVEAEIIGEKRGEKVRVFKMKAKKRYSKTIGHRRNFTVLEIKSIKIGASKATPKKTTAKKTEEAEKEA